MAGRVLKALTLGALVAAAAVPATAQTVVGGSKPEVEVNWGLLDRLGPEPSLPGMLLPQVRPPQAAATPPARQAAPSASGVSFKPYKPAPPRPAHKAAAAPKPAVAKAAPSNPEPVQAASNPPPAPPQAAAPAPARAPEPMPPPKIAAQPSLPTAPAIPEQVPEPPKHDTKKSKGPQVALPSAPTPEPPRPAEPVKAAPPPAPPAPPVEAAAPPPAAPPAPVAPPPAPKMAEAPPPAPAPQQQASLPPAGATARKGGTLSILFASDSASLPSAARTELEDVARRMEKDDALNLQLMAYAEGDESNASKARRLSLSRALEVRKQLMDLGVRSTRIEVRALGNKSEGGPADRVDAVLVGR
ncbi:MAG: OmpA family protein [Actinomycetota bacterium]